MKRFFALVTLAFFLLFSISILTACKKKPKEEPAVEQGAGEQAAPPAEQAAPAPAPAPEQAAPAPAPAPEQAPPAPAQPPQTPGK